MDYTGDPDGPPSNEHPNTHDYDMLNEIYAHSDTFTTIDTSQDVVGDTGGPGKPGFAGFEGSENARDWGRAIKDNGYIALFERDFGGGNKIFTFVIFAK